MSPVFLTGATGFLGTELVRVLQERGRAVHALARPTSDRGIPGGERVCWHEGDLCDVGSVERALRASGARDAVHNAAVISYRTGERAWMERVNVGGTRAVLEACEVAGVRRLVHVSSVVTVGHARDDEILDEASPYRGHELGCDYVDTKRAAEELVLGRRSPTEVVVVNPGAVYGRARALTNTSRFLELLRLRPLLGRLAPPGGLSCVGVADVAEGIAAALEHGRPGERYLLTSENLPLTELYRRALSHAGRSARVARVPPLAWRAATAGLRLVDRVRRQEFATPQALALLGVHFRTRSDKARRELGWSPTPFDAVLRDTLTWLDERESGAD